MIPTTLGVIGLGAIGGSVAWRAALAGVRVVGHARNRRDGVAAVRAGAVTELATNVVAVARGADLLVLAAPPVATLDLLARLGPIIRERGILCTDVASVKAPIVERAARLELEEHFAGSHPFAGTHRRGFPAASRELLAQALVYITPVNAAATPAREVAHFWDEVIGAQPVQMTASRHDALVAWTSHLPQAVASALAGALSRNGPRGVTYGRGALDTTRLAASSVAIWRDVLLLNREPVLAALDRYEDELGRLRAVLEAADATALEAWLDRGARWRRERDR